jgi:hypothetical protein
MAYTAFGERRKGDWAITALVVIAEIKPNITPKKFPVGSVYFSGLFIVTYSVTYIATGSGKAAQGAGLSAALFMGIGELRGQFGANSSNHCVSGNCRNNTQYNAKKVSSRIG